MKKLSFLFFVLLSIGIIGCSSDDDSSGGGNQDNSVYIRFTLNGEEYDFDPETLTSLRTLILGDEEVNNVYTRISLWMPEEPSLGTHTISDDFPSDANLATLYSANVWIGEEVIDASSGVLVITELGDEYVKGTFSFTGTNDEGTTATVTNGSFRAGR
ncbi:MAG: hypothetical protein IM568_08450 [Flavobacterium sp.]|nr:hypothetical protein [Flavobacterium sp.]